MGLINETNSEYYSGEYIELNPSAASINTISVNFDTELFDTATNNPPTISNYEVYTANTAIGPFTWTLLPETAYSVSNNVITFSPAITNLAVKIQLRQTNYGSYAYISLDDIINNFMVGYVGYEKLIPRVNKQDVMFHAKRGLQEFSYDTLKSVKSQELTIPPSLCIPIPQDYVNYVQMSWIDNVGVKHLIFPTRLTSNPTELPLQDGDGIPMQDYLGSNLESEDSITEDRWKEFSDETINTLKPNDYRYPRKDWILGQRYGLEPEEANINGTFTINERTGEICFSSDLVGKIIILEYISDGLAYDGDTKVPKLAEEAMYMHIAYSILAGRRNVPEYIVQRFKRDRSAQLRNAKIRLSNIKLDEFVQVMRGKSKWIKH
jgi:hypothetical protein